MALKKLDKELLSSPGVSPFLSCMLWHTESKCKRKPTHANDEADKDTRAAATAWVDRSSPPELQALIDWLAEGNPLNVYLT